MSANAHCPEMFRADGRMDDEHGISSAALSVRAGWRSSGLGFSESRSSQGMIVTKQAAGRPRIWPQVLLASFLVLVWNVVPSAGSADEYLLQPGDVLKVVIVGAPELSQTVPIEMDGAAWFPLIGAIPAEGVSLNEIRGRVAEAFAIMSTGRPFGPSGELPQIIDESHVFVSIAEYRPVYLTGQVAEPREIPFRPGLTARHVLALASAPGAAPGAARPATSDEIETAATELGREYARIWRLKRFLSIDAPEDYDRIFVADLPAINEIVEIERSIFEAETKSLSEQKQHLETAIKGAEDRVEILQRQRESEAEGLRLDEQTVAHISDLFDKGLAPATRLEGVKRAALVTASRALQVEAAIATARRDAVELEAKLLALDSKAQRGAWEDLSQAVSSAQSMRSRLASVLATAGSAVWTDLLDSELTAVITRAGVTLDAGPASGLSQDLLPGDIIEVRLIPRARSDS